MKPTLLFMAISLALMAPSVMAQDDPVSGTWSGQWEPDGKLPDGVTIELSWNGDALEGGIVGANAVDFAEASFDPASGEVVLVTKAPESGAPYRIEAKVEGNRLMGTVSQGDARGAFKLTKWTYRP